MFISWIITAYILFLVLQSFLRFVKSKIICIWNYKARSQVSWSAKGDGGQLEADAECLFQENFNKFFMLM